MEKYGHAKFKEGKGSKNRGNFNKIIRFCDRIIMRVASTVSQAIFFCDHILHRHPLQFAFQPGKDVEIQKRPGF
jgi:hypothetical protein